MKSAHPNFPQAWTGAGRLVLTGRAISQKLGDMGNQFGLASWSKPWFAQVVAKKVKNIKAGRLITEGSVGIILIKKLLKSLWKVDKLDNITTA